MEERNKDQNSGNASLLLFLQKQNTIGLNVKSNQNQDTSNLGLLWKIAEILEWQYKEIYVWCKYQLITTVVKLNRYDQMY